MAGFSIIIHAYICGSCPVLGYLFNLIFCNLVRLAILNYYHLYLLYISPCIFNYKSNTYNIQQISVNDNSFKLRCV